MKPFAHRLSTGVAATAALSLALVACSDDSDSSLSGGSDGGDGDDHLDIAMVSSLDTEPYYHAEEEGYFEDAGLDVTMSEADAGPSLVTGVLNGTYDAASSAAFPILVALGEGSDLKLFSGATNVAPDHGNSGLVVSEDSSIEGYEDLPGKTVATNALTSLTTLATQIGVDDAGDDPDSIDFTSLPFEQSVQAVDQGDADAAVVISPFQTKAEMEGMDVIDDPIGTQMPEGAPYNVMFTSTETSEDKSEEFTKFNEAVLHAVEDLQNNEDLQRDLAVSVIGLDEDVAAEVELPDYSTEPINEDAFQEYADYVADFGYSDEKVDVSDVIITP